MGPMMDERHTHVEVGYSDHDTIWLRYSEGVEREPCRLWKIPIHRAKDLAEWWRTESSDVKSGKTPIRDKRVGNMRISMFVPTLIRVQGLDKLGRAEVVTYLLPTDVVEYLAAWHLRAACDEDASLS